MDLASLLPPGIDLATLLVLIAILAVSAIMSGLSGFGFSAVGALCLWMLPPKMGVPLLMSLSAANQVMSLGQLKADMKPLKEWWPDGPGPYLLGGLAGVPLGLMILSALPTSTLMAVFGAFLVSYAAYSMLKPASLHVEIKGGWVSSGLVGLVGGIIGGFTAFPGATVVIWSGLRQLHKSESRAIVQPFIFVLQIVSLVLLAIKRPEIFSHTYWMLLLITVPVVLPGTFLGVRLYRSLSDINFRRVTFMLLGLSGFSLLVKAVGVMHLFGGVAHAATH